MAFSLNLFYELRKKAIISAIQEGGLLFEENSENLRDFLYPFWAGMAVDVFGQSGCLPEDYTKFCLLPRHEKIALFNKRALGGFPEFITAFRRVQWTLSFPSSTYACV